MFTQPEYLTAFDEIWKFFGKRTGSSGRAIPCCL